MKQLLIAVIAMCLGQGFTNMIFSQDYSQISDTTWIYEYTDGVTPVLIGIQASSEYDSANVYVSTILNFDPATGELKTGSKLHQEYNEAGQLTFRLMSRWDYMFQSWLETNKFGYFYDEAGKDTLFLSWSKSVGSDEWTSGPGQRTKNTYNNKGQLTVKETYEGYPEAYSRKEKYKYFYDTEGNPVVVERYEWIGSSWVPSAKTVRRLDDNGRENQSWEYIWNGSEWIDYKWIISIYTPEGQLTFLSSNIRDVNSESWIIYHREESVYNEQGLLVLLTRYGNAANLGSLVTERIEYTYNLAGHLDTMLVYKLDEASDEYILYRMEHTTYGNEYYGLYSSICEGEVFTWEGEDYDSEGTYSNKYLSVMGTDSIHTLNLMVGSFPATFSLSGADEVCTEGILLYTAPENPNVVYHWSAGIGDIVGEADGETLELLCMNEGEGEISAWALSVHGCSSDSAVLHLKVHERPASFEIIDITAQDPVCEGETIWYAAPENPDVAYHWSAGIGEIEGEADGDTLVLFCMNEGEGEITAWALSVHGCSSDTSVLNLAVHERPASFVITDISGQEEICEGETVWYAAPKNGNVSYNWHSDQGVVQSGQGKDTLVLQWVDSNNPELICWAENIHGCVSDTASLQVQLNICDGVEENVSAKFSLYPVPVNERLWIESEVEFFRVEIVDMTGASVLSTGSSENGLDLSRLSSGMYLVRLFNWEGKPVGSGTIVKD